MGSYKILVLNIFFIFFLLTSGHNELLSGNSINSPSSSESDEVIQNGISRRLLSPDHEEGLAIEVPLRRNIETTPTTTPMYPPLNPRYRRIYNPDERAIIDDYPFMAAVLVNKELWCGAVIIDRDRVLTAAHCLQLQYNNRFFREYVKMLTVRVGSTNATAGGEVLKVVEISFHPNYKPSTLEFNVAVLKVHKNMSFDKPELHISKIDYARDDIVAVDNNILFLGWGSVLDGGGLSGTVLLQKLILPIYDLADCQATYGSKLVTRAHFCAGYITMKKNVCNHDAGGPAIMDGLLIGILSFSAKRCDLTDQPAVFTNVGAIAPWLDSLSIPGGKSHIRM